MNYYWKIVNLKKKITARWRSIFADSNKAKKTFIGVFSFTDKGTLLKDILSALKLSTKFFLPFIYVPGGASYTRTREIQTSN
jgi:hypothetical protein